MTDRRRRRWVLAPLEHIDVGTPAGASLRATDPVDDMHLAAMLREAYVGTIDFEPESDPARELETWRAHDGADDDASTVAVMDGNRVGACLIGRELGSPLLYELVVAEHRRGFGIARAMLGRSIAALQTSGEESLSAWVTDGNHASEATLIGAGFVPVTPAVDQALGIGYYRAAQAIGTVDVPRGVPLATSSDHTGPTLWIITDGGRSETVMVGDVAVLVERLSPEDPRIRQLSESAMPLRGAAWLLSKRAAVRAGPGERRGAAVVVWRQSGSRREYLLLHRRGFPGRGDWAWTMPSGGRESGETLIECAGRELREETGLVLPLTPVTVPSGYPVFHAEAVAPSTVALDDEHDDYAWLPVEDSVARCRPDRVGASILAVERRLARPG